ncbi:Na(+)/H(+) antiporter subunit C1 [Tepidimonas sediminis]|uniref:Na(+)/H(+) antiporter subunit C1 n=1 Tax=Tepidimonas sediminis TaxID=2588941 RepID=A0A554WJZ3_9BURK|nr:NADH-quinone oxidoreductase subunit K [Tepidimonas sediminis]TSE23865.1 Na(+)/H(+) antiporter subunit C1 [Tepidimonas sediminis]
MIWTVALAVGVALGAGVYLALSRDVLRIVLGLAIAGSAVNLALFASGRLGPAQPAVVPAGQLALEQAANPLPQALVLTAIVIGFALVCFALVLALRLIQRVGSDDAVVLRQAEPPATDPVKPPVTPPAFEPVWPPRDGGAMEGGR